jgi:hypothetical protein
MKRKLLFSLFMALFMATVMSFIMTLVATGLTPGFPARWLKSLIIGVLVAYPTALICAPISSYLTESVLKRNK